MYACVPCLRLMPMVQKRALNPLTLELLAVLSYHVGDGHLTRVL